MMKLKNFMLAATFTSSIALAPAAMAQATAPGGESQTTAPTAGSAATPPADTGATTDTTAPADTTASPSTPDATAPADTTTAPPSDAAAPAAGAQAAPDAAAPADAGGVAVGGTVYGPDGNPVGTIEQVEGANVVLNTGTASATVPASALTPGEKGQTIGWNKAELEAAIAAEKQKSASVLDDKLIAGAEVFTVDKVAAGTIAEVKDDGMVVVNHTTAGPIQLPKAQMTVQEENVTLLTTASDLDAAVSQQAGATAAANS